MEQDMGASYGPGSREPSPEGLGPTGFDPSRIEGLALHRILRFMDGLAGNGIGLALDPDDHKLTFADDLLTNICEQLNVSWDDGLASLTHAIAMEARRAETLSSVHDSPARRGRPQWVAHYRRRGEVTEDDLSEAVIDELMVRGLSFEEKAKRILAIPQIASALALQRDHDRMRHSTGGD